MLRRSARLQGAIVSAGLQSAPGSLPSLGHVFKSALGEARKASQRTTTASHVSLHDGPRKNARTSSSHDHSGKKARLDPSVAADEADVMDAQATPAADSPLSCAAPSTLDRAAASSSSSSQATLSVFRKGKKQVVVVSASAGAGGDPAPASASHGELVARLTAVSSPVDRLVGYHVSTAGGVENAPINAALAGANAFAMDTRSKRKWESAPYSASTISLFRERCQLLGFTPKQVLPHGSYLINVGSPDKALLKKSQDSLVEEVKRCEQLGLTQYNFHPGSTTGLCSVEDSIKSIAAAIDMAIGATKGVTVVIESMAGQGHSIGGKFEELRDIIRLVKNKDRIGVCLDTCHMFAAGFDLRTEEAYAKVMADFDKVVGFSYLRGLHMNDSKGELGCRKDRHENIGKGKVGLEGFRLLMNDERLKHVPMILETPPCSEDELECMHGYRTEIELLRSLVGKPDKVPAPATGDKKSKPKTKRG